MKKFIKWKILIITSVVCLLPILMGLALWDKLPDVMAIHFDINNNPDGFASKGFVVFGLPVLMVLLQTICCVINDVNAKKFGERKKLETATKWIIPVMSVILQFITLGYGLKMDFDIRKWVMVIIGAVFILTGNYLPKFDYIKNEDTQKARRINRFIGIFTFILGIIAIITIFLPPVASVIWLFSLIAYTVISVIYSILVINS